MITRKGCLLLLVLSMLFWGILLGALLYLVL